MLGPLAGNGGPTQTMALLAGSPAIDAGNNALALDANGQPLTTDQRGIGFPRIVNNIVDIGAFEVPSLIVTTLNDVVDPTDGQTSLREAIAYADTLSSDPTITFADGLTGTIVLTQGALPITTRMTITGPGAGQLAVSGNGATQVLKIDDHNVANEIDVTITGLAFADGHGIRTIGFLKGVTQSDGTDLAGAIYNNETLTLSNVRSHLRERQELKNTASTTPAT